MTYLILIGVVQVAILLALLLQIAVLRGQIAETLAWYAGEEVVDSIDVDALETESEEEVELSEYADERRTAFNERIARIKEELDAEHVERRGTIAEELHPDVQNIPHVILHNKQTNPPDEIAN